MWKLKKDEPQQSNITYGWPLALDQWSQDQTKAGRAEHERNTHGADGELCRWRGERSEITDVGKVRQAICKLQQQLHGRAHINYTGPLCGQRLQTRVLRIDPNTLMMLQLSWTYHSSLFNALSTAACRHIPHTPLISPQTFLRASLPLFFHCSLIYVDTSHSVFLPFLLPRPGKTLAITF